MARRISIGSPVSLRRRKAPEALFITNISIEKLYDTLSYSDIDLRQSLSDVSRISVMYGDNGAGKTTILKLIYSTLSPEGSAGLRTYLARTPFLEFSLTLSDGTRISIKKEALVGNYTIRTRRKLGGWVSYEVEMSADHRVRTQDSVTEYEEFLESLSLDILFVDHTRAVRSTYSFLSEISNTGFGNIDDFNNEYEIAYGSDRPGFKRISQAEIQFPLYPMVEAAESWFREQAYRQGAAGDQNASAVYLEITKALVRRRSRANEPSAEIDLRDKLLSLDSVTQSYVQHKLLAPYPFTEIANIYDSASNAKKRQIEVALAPFLDSIQRRVTALTTIHDVITVFEVELQKFFSRKDASFDIYNGLVIQDRARQLELDALSSGEKQLLFLLCAAVVARASRSIILIDEPELSLNYKWQRQIAQSLSNVSAAANTQFVLASHSIEIISRYVNSAVELVSDEAS